PEARRYEPPQGEIETAIAQIWQDLLGLDSISRSQSFLEAGGDSLVATEMVKMVGGALGVELSLRQIFSEPTIAGLGGVVTEALAQSSADTMEEGSL
ncbi:phosphopantetheine-binding protein, partial [Pseudophaeobacter sp.]|uniref:phosphopantetheine-binding protein n=1 Tax=Pseudophaeobacter sp. TaxID=1971739 RepID=UPI004059EEBC